MKYCSNTTNTTKEKENKNILTIFLLLFNLVTPVNVKSGQSQAAVAKILKSCTWPRSHRFTSIFYLPTTTKNNNNHG